MCMRSHLTVCYPMDHSPQALLSMGFPRYRYWSGSPFPPPGDLSDPGIKHMSPASAGRFFTTEPQGSLRREEGDASNLEGWDRVGGGKEVQEGRDIYIHLWLIHVDIRQKPTQHGKTFILQLKINQVKELEKRSENVTF